MDFYLKKINTQFFLKIFIIIQIIIFILDVILGGYFNFVLDFFSILLFFNIIIAFILTVKNLDLETCINNMISIFLSGLAIIWIIWYIFSIGIQYYKANEQHQIYSLSGKLVSHDKYRYSYDIYGYGKIRKTHYIGRAISDIPFIDLETANSDRLSLVCGLHQYISCSHFFDLSDYNITVKFYTLSKNGDYYNVIIGTEWSNGNLNLLKSYKFFFIMEFVVCFIFLFLYVFYFCLLIRRYQK